jgi:hypothetical protein
LSFLAASETSKGLASLQYKRIVPGLTDYVDSRWHRSRSMGGGGAG